jgi:hypothetical protein
MRCGLGSGDGGVSSCQCFTNGQNTGSTTVDCATATPPSITLCGYPG